MRRREYGPLAVIVQDQNVWLSSASGESNASLLLVADMRPLHVWSFSDDWMRDS
jgi:hypothetical protein